MSISILEHRDRMGVKPGQLYINGTMVPRRPVGDYVATEGDGLQELAKRQERHIDKRLHLDRRGDFSVAAASVGCARSRPICSASHRIV